MSIHLSVSLVVSLQFQVYVQFYVSPHLVDDLKQDDWKINTTIDTHYT